jgi:hypothetical protein
LVAELNLYLGGGIVLVETAFLLQFVQHPIRNIPWGRHLRDLLLVILYQLDRFQGKPSVSQLAAGEPLAPDSITHPGDLDRHFGSARLQPNNIADLKGLALGHCVTPDRVLCSRLR